MGADHAWSRFCVTSSAGKLDLELSPHLGESSLPPSKTELVPSWWLQIWQEWNTDPSQPHQTGAFALLSARWHFLEGGGGVVFKPTFSGRASSSSSSHKVHCFPTWWRVQRFLLLLLRKCIQTRPDDTTRNPSRSHNFNQETLNNVCKLCWPRRDYRDYETKLQEWRTPQTPPGFRTFIRVRRPIKGSVTLPPLCWTLQLLHSFPRFLCVLK